MKTMEFLPEIGAVYLGDGKCRFRTWAPFKKSLEVRLLSPVERTVPMCKEKDGYWSAVVENVGPGARYLIRLDGKTDRPDPASFYQPDGVHGPSEIVDPRFESDDRNWAGIALKDYIFYEVHVGTFTPGGTLDALVEKLDHIAALGATSLELMPLAQFPGERNWGYDGACPFAVHNSYGGPVALRHLVNGCHRKGISVTLDVVYNHLGPEGTCLRDFGPYFTPKYLTPWGEAINFDDEYNREVRNFFIQNALFWLGVYNIDALRLDAVHAIHDRSAVPFLSQLAGRVKEFGEKSGRIRHLIAESDLNDSRLIRPQNLWGCDLDAQWSDDFHHGLHALLTGERGGYYIDFGKVSDLATCWREGYLYSGRYSEFRKRNHGNRSADLPSEKFVVASQNHDQVGNRLLGERLSTLVSFEALKLAAAVVLLSPFLPLLFMGEEYGEPSPFLYFVDHSDPRLRKAVREGRRAEFKEFFRQGEPPDPESRETFMKSRLDLTLAQSGEHRALLGFYRALIRFRRQNPLLSRSERDDMEVRGFEEKKLLLVGRKSAGSNLFILYNFRTEDQIFDPLEIGLPDRCRKLLDSSQTKWEGPGESMPEYTGRLGSLRIRASSAVLYS